MEEKKGKGDEAVERNGKGSHGKGVDRGGGGAMACDGAGDEREKGEITP